MKKASYADFGGDKINYGEITRPDCERDAEDCNKLFHSIASIGKTAPDALLEIPIGQIALSIGSSYQIASISSPYTWNVNCSKLSTGTFRLQLSTKLSVDKKFVFYRPDVLFPSLNASNDVNGIAIKFYDSGLLWTEFNVYTSQFGVLTDPSINTKCSVLIWSA